MNIEMHGAGSAQWPDRGWAAASRAERRDGGGIAAAEQRGTVPFTAGVAPRTNAPAPLSQRDFDLATQLGPNAVSLRSPDQLTGIPKVERRALTGADRAAAAN